VTTDAKPAATRRILDAARSLVERGGAAHVSTGEVAAAAGVSKALVHYHFQDKDSLLCALAEEMGFGLLARAADAVAVSDAGHTLDVYWAWLDRELRGGDLRILLALAEYDSDRVRDTTRRILGRRRAATAEQVERIFGHLGLSPRVPSALIADTVLAFTDGLAMSKALEPDRDPRPAFDVLWLALLTLAE
jgi:AcrR family transcriptional regulator